MNLEAQEVGWGAGVHVAPVTEVPVSSASDADAAGQSAAPVEVQLCTITPCEGRSALVQALLRSLDEDRRALGAPPGAIQFILVDSTEEVQEAEAIEATCARYGASYLRGPRSVRAKRNQGARMALDLGAPQILFIDSDCRAAPGLLAQHLRAAKQRTSALTGRPVGGATGVTRFVGRHTRAFQAASCTPFLDSFHFAESMPEAPWAPCTNCSFDSARFFEVGGFQESWEFRLGGDDVELGRRLNNAGYALVCLPEAVVLHDTETWSRWGPLFERAWRWGRMDIRIRATEPAANRHLAGPEPWTVAFALAPLAVSLGPRSLLWLVLATATVPLTAGSLRGRGGRDLAASVASEYLLAAFTIASILQALKIRKPQLAFTEIVTHPMQVGTSWNVRRRNAWLAVGLAVVWSLATLATR